ncbi:hypothetical protein REPUB_Repub18cG0124700 [Reevesia pubescens]
MKETRRGSFERLLPSELDNLSLRYCKKDGSLVKATFSCDDRPELMSDLQREVRKVDGTIMSAEMMLIGGSKIS